MWIKTKMILEPVGLILLCTNFLCLSGFSKDSLRLPIGQENDTYERMQSFSEWESPENRRDNNDKKITRRDFLKQTIIAVGTGAVGTYLQQEDVTARESKILELETGQIKVRAGQFILNDRPVYIVGANFQIFDYGNRDVESKFKAMAEVGIRIVRLNIGNGFLFPDIVKWEGDTIGINKELEAEIQMLIDTADRYNLQIQFILTSGADFTLNTHPRIITDIGFRRDFLRHFVKPFLKKFGNHRAVFSFEIIACPELVIRKFDWGIHEEQGRFGQGISRKSVETFVKEMSILIRHEAQGKLITVNIASDFTKFFRELPLDYYTVSWTERLKGFDGPLVDRNKISRHRPVLFVATEESKEVYFATKEYIELPPDSIHEEMLQLECNGAVTEWKLALIGDAAAIAATSRKEKMFYELLREFVEEHGEITRLKEFQEPPKKPTTWGEIKKVSDGGLQSRKDAITNMSRLGALYLLSSI